ncbi:QueT transporter [Melghirimyces profundicolus]|uniref:QueT transporter n=1 Tax=Melghirimyces profundicolus TaxID=1242148 RepID=A0A2T6C7M1_9BACL|nr:QueT transporter [Melghirimyces profundicolus]
MPFRWLAPLPPVLVNAVIIGILLETVTGLDVTLPAAMLYVGGGQLAVCCGFGLPFCMCWSGSGSKPPAPAPVLNRIPGGASGPGRTLLPLRVA